MNELKPMVIRINLSISYLNIFIAREARVSEMAAIQISDIDFKRGFLRIIRKKKTEAKQEMLAIGKDIIAHLKEHLQQTDRTSGPLFVGQRGPLSAQGFQ